MTSETYRQIRSFSVTLRGREVRVYTKAGLPDELVPATVLLAEEISASPDSRALVLGCGQGALGVAIARQAPQGRVWLTDVNSIALDMARRTLDANTITNATIINDVTVPQELLGTCDIVALDAPPNRTLARRWLATAFAALREGGILYVGGANDIGIQPLIADAHALFGRAGQLVNKRRSRVASAIKTGQVPQADWAHTPGIEPGSYVVFEAELGGEQLTLHSLPGVFSYDRVDAGTRLLLEHLGRAAGARVLDLGCGYGAIGLQVARMGAAQVDMVDANIYAVAAAQRTINAYGLTNARAVAADVRDASFKRGYDLVVTNPPFHQGKVVDYDVAYEFIRYARDVIAPRGRFVLVTNNFIRYDAALRDLFGQVEQIGRNSSYRVWQARPTSDEETH
jgi:16S rRNA (guanine1207-N2)-methyltransferase